MAVLVIAWFWRPKVSAVVEVTGALVTALRVRTLPITLVTTDPAAMPVPLTVIPGTMPEPLLTVRM